MINTFTEKALLFFFALLLTCLSTTQSKATNDCDFQLTLIEATTNEKLKDYTVKRMGTGETDYLESESKYSTIRFVRLTEQRYEIEVSKKGYSSSVFYLECFAVEDQDTIQITVPIWKNESKTEEDFLDFEPTSGKLKKVIPIPSSERRIPNSKKREVKKEIPLSLQIEKTICLEKPKVNSE